MIDMSTETKMKPVESRPIQFSIRYKLLLIVSLIIILGLSSIILLVTFFYKGNSEVLIQEYNLSLARLAGVQVESNLKNSSSNPVSSHHKKLFRSNQRLYTTKRLH